LNCRYQKNVIREIVAGNWSTILGFRQPDTWYVFRTKRLLITREVQYQWGRLGKLTGFSWSVRACAKQSQKSICLLILPPPPRKENLPTPSHYRFLTLLQRFLTSKNFRPRKGSFTDYIALALLPNVYRVCWLDSETRKRIAVFAAHSFFFLPSLFY
jgi:hypothetical protein